MSTLTLNLDKVCGSYYEQLWDNIKFNFQYASLTYCCQTLNVQIILLLFSSTQCQDRVGYTYFGYMIKTDFMSNYADKINLKHIVLWKL